MNSLPGEVARASAEGRRLTPDTGRRRPLLGVVGCGAMGAALTELFAGHGFPVYLAGGRRRSAEDLAARVPAVTTADLDAVAEKADVLILATPVRASCLEIAPRIGHRLAGKVLMDVSNPGPADLYGIEHRSAAELIAESFPKSVVVKALNCVSARQVRAVAHGGPAPTVPIAGDDHEAKRSIAQILRQTGFDAADAGPLDSSRWIEGLTELLRRLGHEEGLGDAVGFRLLRLAPTARTATDIREPEGKTP
ncbi:NADPH-dependent F420 reductase [Streptosporangium sp. H16]|uniref:NADPH-dependent F420 reductase n=1 Tax=Streptosporangium sp. H16 TaxID=3444184 RepID=UPI003F79A4F2